MHSREVIDIVKAKRDEGQTIHRIADDMNLSPSTVYSMIKNDYNKPKKKRGAKPALKKREKVRIKRACERLRQAEEKVTSKKIKKNCDLEVSTRTIQRTLKKMGYAYKKATVGLVLSKAHKEARVNLARSWISNRVDWTKVVFSDEKRFSLDGPDNWCSYAREMSPVQRNRRQQGGGSVMVWGVLLSNGDLLLEEVSERMNSDVYINLLKNKGLPFIRDCAGDDFIFQHDNCSIHVSKKTSEYLKNECVELLEWPSRSPDLNPIENVWEMLSQIIYDGPEIKTKAELKEKIWVAKNRLMSEKSDSLCDLFSNYCNRLFELFEKKGAKINY
jgi:transposase